MTRRDPATVDFEDVDDIIGIAGEMVEIDDKHLSVEELREVASELDIPEANVEPAIVELRRRRQLELARTAAAQKRRVMMIRVGAVVLGCIAAVLVFVNSQLNELHGDVRGRRAQVDNVVERRSVTLAQWEGQPDSDDKNAELSGASNRVAVELRKYDKAATAYNDARSGILGRVVGGLFGLPRQAPLSSQLNGWTTR